MRAVLVAALLAALPAAGGDSVEAITVAMIELCEPPAPPRCTAPR